MLCPIFPKQILKKKKAIQVTSTGLINQSNCSNTKPALSVPQDSYTLKVCTYIYSPVQSLLIKFSAFKGEVPKLQRKFDLSSLLSVILKKKNPDFIPQSKKKSLTVTQLHFPILSSEHLQAFPIQIIVGHKMTKDYYNYTVQSFKLSPHQPLITLHSGSSCCACP